MKTKWQQEMDAIRLTEAQKRRIEAKLSAPRLPRLYKVIAPTFVSLCLLFVIASLNVSSETLSQASSWMQQVLEQQKVGSGWVWAVLVLTISVIVQAAFFPIYTTRLAEQPKVAYYQRWKRRQPIFWWGALVLVLIGMALLILFASTVPNSAPFFQVAFLTLVTANMMGILCFVVRKEQAPTCPHCQQTLSKREMRKLWWRSYNKTCPHCDEKIYVSKETQRLNGYVMVYLPFIFIAQFVDVSFFFVIAQAVLYFTFVMVYFHYYATKFTAEEQYLW